MQDGIHGIPARMEAGEIIFKRTVDRLLNLPGHAEVGHTPNTHDRYAIWYPYEDEKIYVRFVLYGEWHGQGTHVGEVVVDSNLTEL